MQFTVLLGPWDHKEVAGVETGTMSLYLRAKSFLPSRCFPHINHLTFSFAPIFYKLRKWCKIFLFQRIVITEKLKAGELMASLSFMNLWTLQSRLLVLDGDLTKLNKGWNYLFVLCFSWYSPACLPASRRSDDTGWFTANGHQHDGTSNSSRSKQRRWFFHYLGSRNPLHMYTVSLLWWNKVMNRVV